MLAYYDLRTMTLSLILGTSIVAATLLCHLAVGARTVHLTWSGGTESIYPPDDLVGSEMLPSVDGLRMPMDGSEER